MKTVHSPKHRLQDGRSELNDGKLVPCFEQPRRVEMILDRVNEVGLGPVVPPTGHGLGPLARVHTGPFLRFLESAWGEWVAEHGAYDALPLAWPTRTLRRDVEPIAVDGRLSFFSFDAGTPITAGTWEAARAAADVALTGADLIRAGEPAAFALGRPPGHHAAADVYGGYCFLNNAAIAAQALIDGGASRVAVLDVDYHHGNGTQAIFYRRPDVLFLSLHADPRHEFPYFLGHADERGAGPGEGFTVNHPLPWGTGLAPWLDALDDALRRVAAHAPDALVVSLGVDTFEDDPISRFRLKSEDFPLVGGRIARLRLPTLFVMEGGYAVEAIGVNAVGVLQGFEDA